ncbi:hypothetical protein [Sphaerisporangium aureirubrum]|uniref:WxL domain-containing protein n=1 Tax=Sphaerisporangium aureirubrum TaxID=1544736 RepID=A0ABW1NTZ0_9ACTN
MSNIRYPRIAFAAFVLTAGGMLGPGAPAAQADTDTGSTTVNVEVTSSITLTDLTPEITLTGAPGEVPTAQVTMVVTTNNFAGYNVTVVPRTANLTPAIVGNTDVIPASSLQVSGPAQTGAFVNLTPGTPLVVATSDDPSPAGGDSITNNYRITVPYVRPDVYSGILDYVVTTL